MVSDEREKHGKASEIVSHKSDRDYQNIETLVDRLKLTTTTAGDIDFRPLLHNKNHTNAL